jgi:hypothetical protein
MALKNKYCPSKKTHKTKKLPSYLESFEYKYIEFTYALLAAAIKFSAEPALNQPICPSL